MTKLYRLRARRSRSILAQAAKYTALGMFLFLLAEIASIAAIGSARSAGWLL